MFYFGISDVSSRNITSRLKCRIRATRVWRRGYGRGYGRGYLIQPRIGHFVLLTQLRLCLSQRIQIQWSKFAKPSPVSGSSKSSSELEVRSAYRLQVGPFPWPNNPPSGHNRRTKSQKNDQLRYSQEQNVPIKNPYS